MKPARPWRSSKLPEAPTNSHHGPDSSNLPNSSHARRNLALPSMPRLLSNWRRSPLSQHAWQEPRNNLSRARKISSF